jgi:hypothetical protein
MSFTYPIWQTALLVSMLLLLAGCAASLDYPQGWSSTTERVLPHGCPDLTGIYSTQAAEIYPADIDTLPRLNEILGPGGLSHITREGRPWPTFPDFPVTASFTSDGDWLYVHYSDGADGAATLKFKRKHWWGGLIEESDAMYFCHQSELGPSLGIDGSLQPDFAVPESFFGRGVDFLSSPITPVLSLVLLSKGKEGSLIVNFRTGYVSVARIGYLPIGMFQTTLGSIWWRFPAAHYPNDANLN